MKTPAIIAHCDANSFYCSCHRVFEPALLGRPVGVLSNNDGCIIARTAELKALGITMGAPFFKARPLMQQGRIFIRSSNYPLYGDMSARFMSVLESFTPEVEVYSIDEAFLRFDGFSPDSWQALGQQIKDKVGLWTGLPIGVGLSTTKVLAKLANYAAKHYPATGGIVDLTSTQRQKKLLRITPIEEVWGIGRRLSQRLKNQNIHTAMDFASLSPSLVRKQYSVTEERLVRELRGENCLPWDEESGGNKHTILCSRSFGQPVTSKTEVQQAVATFVSRACEKLRSQSKNTAKAQLFLRTDPFRPEAGQYNASLILQAEQPTASTQAWLHLAHAGVDKIYRDGFLYRKAGFVLLDIGDDRYRQNDLFQNNTSTSNGKSPQMMKTLDAINERFGSQTLHPAATGVKSARWHMKQNYLSPCYTTRWPDIPLVSCRT